MSRLTFTEGNHQYRLADPDTGKSSVIPSVTGLLGLLEKPALKRWAANTAADYAIDHWESLTELTPSERRKVIAAAPWQSRDRAAAKGTQIHEWAELLVAGKPVEIPDAYLSTVEGFARWWEGSGFAAVASERRVWSEADDEMGLCAYSGTFDLLAEHSSYGRTLLDHKTGTGVYGDFGVQLAAYSDAEFHVVDDTDVTAPIVDTLAVVHIRLDGSELHVLDAEQRRRASERFTLLRALRLIEEPAFRQVIA